MSTLWLPWLAVGTSPGLPRAGPPALLCALWLALGTERTTGVSASTGQPQPEGIFVDAGNLLFATRLVWYTD
jgi:hypothetical protein